MSASYFDDDLFDKGFKSGKMTYEDRSTRKRIPIFNNHAFSESKIKMPLPELDFNDPDFLKILKEYEKEDDDYPLTSVEREKELQALRMRAKSRPILDQGLTYVCLFLAFGLFVLLINWCNTKELQRLKEEYGYDAQKEMPEIWWKKAVIYRLHVPTFSDSNGDGVGDLRGVLNNLDYFIYLGVDAIVLRSLMDYSIEEGYVGVRNFTNVDSKLGNLHFLSVLVKEFHEKGIKMIVEIIPNHTSRKHVWFQNSRASKQTEELKGGNDGDKYRNYYTWHRGKLARDGSRSPPNNWVGVDHHPAWTCDPRTGCYYHHFHRNLPDLNHRNVDVQREMLATFKFWLDRGFDAIYLGHVSPLFESLDVDRDEPDPEEVEPFDDPSPVENSVSTHTHTHAFTLNQPELHDYLGSWNEFVQSYSIKRGQRLALLIDISDESGAEMAGIAKNYFSWADTPIVYTLMNINEACGGTCLQETIETSVDKLLAGRDPMWMVGPKERVGATSAVYHNIHNALLMLLPGGTMMSTGSEMGVFEDQRDYLSPRHNYMFDQLVRNLTLSASAEAIFLPSVSSASSVTPSSASLKVIHLLTRIRKEQSFFNGQMQYAVVDDDILSFVRFARDEKPYLVALNFGSSSSTEDYSLSAGTARGKMSVHIIPHKIVGHNPSSDLGDPMEGHDLPEGSVVDLSKLTLRPGEGVVVNLLLGNHNTEQNLSEKDDNTIHNNNGGGGDVIFDAN